MEIPGGFAKLLNLKVADMFRTSSQIVSIDIGSSAVKLLEVDGDPNLFKVERYGQAPLSSTAVQNNMVQNPEEVASVIRRLVDELGVRANRAVTAVPGPAVIIKKIQIPNQAAADLENAILFEAGNFIPESLENVNLDYQVVGYSEDDGQLEALLVAVKKDIINSYTAAIRGAGFDPVVVDVDYFALENMFERIHPPDPQEVVALVDMGSRYSCINILRGGVSTFTGDVPVGGKEFQEALVRSLDVTADDAERILKGSHPDHSLEQVEPILTPVREFLADEIQRALSFFWTAATDEAITGVYLSGGTASSQGLAEQLQEKLEIPVAVTNPFTSAEWGPGVDNERLLAQAPTYAIAAGLAARRPGDK